VALWNRFQSILFGGAIGAAARTAIEPQIEPARQLAWSNNRNRILELGELAELVAEGLVSEADVDDLVKRNGYELDSLRAIVATRLAAPELGTLLTARRRRDITAAEFDDGLAKLKIKPEFRPAIRQLLDARLSPADVANAVQQGFVPNAGLLPDDPGGSPPFTPPVELVDIDTLEEFQAGGVPPARARVLAELVGLPPGPMELLEMWRRGIITETAVEHGIREGHTKTKWTSALKALRHPVLSARDYAELWLRGWLTEAEAKAGGELTGYLPRDMELLYLNRGRPATTHQVHIGYARGGTYQGENLTEREAFARAVRNSNIRTEYTDILWAGRFTYPSAFVVRALAQDGTFNEAQTRNILLESGWRDDYAALAAGKWAGGGTSTGGKWADRSRSQAWSTIHSSFTSRQVDESEARAALELLGIPFAEVETILDVWNIEAAFVRRELTPAQVKAAYKKANYSRDVAIAELEERGYSFADAGTYLDS
jgi:hypothetical protein